MYTTRVEYGRGICFHTADLVDTVQTVVVHEESGMVAWRSNAPAFTSEARDAQADEARAEIERLMAHHAETGERWEVAHAAERKREMHRRMRTARIAYLQHKIPVLQAKLERLLSEKDDA